MYFLLKNKIKISMIFLFFFATLIRILIGIREDQNGMYPYGSPDLKP